MLRSGLRIISGLIITLALIQCDKSEEIIIESVVTGPVDANCYLLYGSKTKEAALIDVGGPIDSLVQIIEDEGLKLKYLLCTHGHFDHVMGLENIINNYPDAKYCLNKIDYEDMLVQLDWILNKYPKSVQDMWRADPKGKVIFDFAPEKYGLPDIFLEDEMILDLGHNNIRAIHAPGHSAGSICFGIGDKLFSGDVLFYRSVGNTNSQNSSREDIIKSVRRLYDIFPDETIVFPGHGQSTTIGAEKSENSMVTEAGGSLLENF